jgi:SAM-dependent methyltransferase
MASDDPFFSVLTWNKFRRKNLTQEAVDEFFATGESYIDHLFRTIRAHIDPDFNPQRSLDFGCGLGRLVVPLSKRSGSVVGLDVSEAMLRGAREHLDRLDVRNVELVRSDDALTSLEGSFDLVHSFIVFQHIPVRRGEALFRKLLGHMRDRSVGALHLAYANTRDPLHPGFLTHFKRLRIRAESALRTLRGIGNMQMHNYDLNVIFRILQEEGVRRTHVELTDHDRALGALILFQKRDNDVGFA